MGGNVGVEGRVVVVAQGTLVVGVVSLVGAGGLCGERLFRETLLLGTPENTLISRAMGREDGRRRGKYLFWNQT